MKKTSQEKGITLIALIITIVVLLILASVTITSIQDDGIIGKAKEARKKYEEAQIEEKDELIEYEYFLEKVDNPDIETYEEYVLEKKYGLKIGDYVNYTYDTVSTGYSLTKQYSGYTSDQTITQTTGLQWRVLGLDENGNIELVSATPAQSMNVYFRGEIGYNNAVYLLNDMCKELYSNKELGITARSLTIEDMEEKFSEEGIKARNSFKGRVQYGETATDYNDEYSSYYPLIYAEEEKSGVTGTIREGGIGQSEAFYTKKEDLTVGYTEDITAGYAHAKDSNGNDVSLKATQTYYYFGDTPKTYFKNETIHNMLFEGSYYWFASRSVNFSDWGISFGLRFVSGTGLYSIGLFHSSRNVDEKGRLLRPVVSIGSNFKVDTSSGSGTASSVYGLVKVN